MADNGGSGVNALAIVAILVLVLGAGFIAGVMYLFGLSFAAGNVYPQFSSLRSDPRGARLLYESLAALPGVTVSRNLVPLEFLPGSGATVV